MGRRTQEVNNESLPTDTVSSCITVTCGDLFGSFGDESSSAVTGQDRIARRWGIGTMRLRCRCVKVSITYWHAHEGLFRLDDLSLDHFGDLMDQIWQRSRDDRVTQERRAMGLRG